MYQIIESVGLLRGRQVDLRLAAPLEAAHPDVADDADDGPVLEGLGGRDRLAARSPKRKRRPIASCPGQ